MINTNKIKGRLKELCLTQSDVAKAMNLSQSTVTQKINKTRPLTILEAEKLSEILKIDDEQYKEYFFA